MIINHNISALNTYRQLSTNNTNTQKSLEKLSSGLRINRAGDDAAGLAISEKMRAQIRGLEQAQRNSQDAISLIQTAEGGLNETHAILQRMRELAIQAANDTNVDVDRNEIQKEINQLTSEINRIGNTTEFNTQKLLNGGPATKTYTGGTFGNLSDTNVISAVSDIKGTVTLANGTYTIATGATFTKTVETVYSSADTKVENITGFTGDLTGFKFTWTDAGGDSEVQAGEIAITDASWSVNIKSGALGTKDLVLTFTNGTQSFEYNVGDALTSGDQVTVGDITGTTNETFSGYVAFNNENVAVNTDGKATFSNGLTIDFSKAAGASQTATVEVIGATEAGTTPGVAFSATFQIGANTGQSFTIEIGDMRSESLEISTSDNTIARTVEVDGKIYTVAWTATSDVTNGTDNKGVEYALDVSSHDNATAAVKVINDAIEKVSAERSKLGAFQNRLEHTINNLGTSAENLTAAESRIRDVDMAKEMMEFTKQSILSQAAQAMLAQANQQPQGVLQLLR